LGKILGIRDILSLFLKEDNGFERFREILNELKKAESPLYPGFLECLTIFSWTNKINLLGVLLTFVLHCFQKQEFEYIEIIMTQIKDLILLVIANNISQDQVEI